MLGGMHTERPPRFVQAILICIASLLFLIAAIELGYTFNLPEKLDGPHYPKFLMVGDWGRNGDFNQTTVADAMARKASTLGPLDFILSVGDNFYESGLVSHDDPQFKTSFTDVYHHKALRVPWHVALGNHDYGEWYEAGTQPNCTATSSQRNECYFSPLHQLDSRLTLRDPRWHCERTFTLVAADGEVEFFFIDTTPMVQVYYSEPWRFNHGGLLNQSWQAQLLELEGKLARSQAKWKLLVGHHPIHSNHRTGGDYLEIVDNLKPLVLKYGVQTYFSGHDHNLQHIYNPSWTWHQVITGGGSQVGDGFNGSTNSPFQYDYNGFVAVTMKSDKMTVEYLGLNNDTTLFSIDVARVPLKSAEKK